MSDCIFRRRLQI